MARHASVSPNSHIHTTIPLELRTRVDLLLYSPAEGRVPVGALQSLLVALLRQWLDDATLDLAPYTGVLPGQEIVRGSPFTIEKLTNHLKGDAK